MPCPIDLIILPHLQYVHDNRVKSPIREVYTSIMIKHTPNVSATELLSGNPDTTWLHTNPSTSSTQIIRAPPTAAKDSRVVTILPTRRPTDIELDTIQWGQKLDGPEQPSTTTPVELEQNSRPNSPSQSRAHEVSAIVLPTVKSPYMNRWRIPTLCLGFFIQGLNDSAPGALLPYMQQHYHIEYAIVSLIFVGNAVGFIAAAPVCHTLNNRFGRAKVLSACALLNSLAYLAIACQPPWPVVVVAFLALGKLP